jgi:O-antigen/teichoic acid export membrane protein
MIRFRFDFRIARELVGFGGYLFLSGLFAFFIFNVDNFIIGSVKGAKELGYYAVAFNWASMICLIMYSVVLRVIFPVMAKLQDQVMEIRSAYLKTLEYSSYLIVLANIALFVISKEFLVSVLGHGSDSSAALLHR